ncbi:putative Glyceraldehyde 3-phosphate phosphatase [Tenacibaculum sp. 190130A14a]|uniref:Glyceraldehyde 3-phosphate phosphatase n=1 Tax=Tenacibaculum polynesiense TaxID=3137857 RepID=A0ABM9P9L8_9FLAO
MKNVKTIVFDLYNTLIKIKEPKHFFVKLYRKSKNGFNLDISSYMKLVMTKSLVELEEMLPSEFKKLFKENKNDLEKELNSVVVFKEVYNILSRLEKCYNLFLISNLAEPYKEPFFDKKLDQYFEKVIFSCDYGSIKPEEKIFKEIEEITGNQPNEIMMIGDSLKSDIEIPKRLGWHFFRIERKEIGKDGDDVLDLKEILNS